MNNQYKRVITPKAAQELIQELFAGQTVQRRKIIETVDKVHSERGGQPSRAKVHHPVEHALSKMKRLGLAENPECGVWFIMPSNKMCEIKTLDDFTKWTKKFAPGECVFRGLPNQNYGIQASAYRRPKKDDRDFEKFLRINKDLIDEVILRGYDEKNGRKLSHLEILAELQHFGAATCLIDFSHSAQVALWFACQLCSKAPQDSENPPNGKVFAVYNRLPRFKKIKSDLLNKTIDDLLQDEEDSQLYHWQPQQQNNRIIAQQSIFLFGCYEFQAHDECIVLGNDKQNILSELEQVSGITEAMLFPDFAKFASLRGEDALYTGLDRYEYLQLASEQFELGNYAESIAYYDRVLDQDPDYMEAYYKRGLAKLCSDQYESAIFDLDKFISVNPENMEAYFDRAQSNLYLGNLDTAQTDAEKALSLAEKSKEWEDAGKIGLLLNDIYERIDGGGDPKPRKDSQMPVKLQTANFLIYAKLDKTERVTHLASRNRIRPQTCYAILHEIEARGDFQITWGVEDDGYSDTVRISRKG